MIACIDAFTSLENTANVELSMDIHKAAKRNPIYSYVKRQIKQPMNIGRNAVNIMLIEEKFN